MCGGAYEYVAACYQKENVIKLTGNSDYISKYIDVYDKYSSSKFGDAVFETSSDNSGSNSWFSDYSSFFDSSSSVLIRGGYYNSGSNAGLFFFSCLDSSSGIYNGFRPVCIVK